MFLPYFLFNSLERKMKEFFSQLFTEAAMVMQRQLIPTKHVLRPAPTPPHVDAVITKTIEDQQKKPERLLPVQRKCDSERIKTAHIKRQKRRDITKRPCVLGEKVTQIT